MNRPFDLKAALSGEPIKYRDLVVCEFLRLSKWEGKPCIQFARVGERCEHLTSDLDGKVMFCSDGGDTRLTMAPRKVKRTVWVNFVQKEADFCAWHSTKKKAEEVASNCPSLNYLAVAIPVEIEVEE